MVAGSPGERVRRGIVILASVSELGTWEVIMSGTPGEIVRVGTAELASAPRLVPTECLVSGSLLEKTGGVVGTVGLVSAEGMTNETAISGLCGESV